MLEIQSELEITAFPTNQWRKRLEDQGLDIIWAQREWAQVARNSKRMEVWKAKVVK